MKTMIKQFLAVLILAPLAFSVLAQPARFVEGTHYTVLPTPVKTNDPSKVEVVEVFWYGCAHCFRFEPLIEDWAANIPADVDFVRFPGMWNELMKIHAQVFYAAEALGKLDVLHGPIFNAINVEGNRLQNEQQISTFFAKYGVSEEDFSRTFNSFSVKTKVNQAEAKMREYQVRSTPNMVVNGKYLISTGDAVRTQQEMLEVVDFLVNKERSSS
jgi:thiol:disulfide interchange protein DsbA